MSPTAASSAAAVTKFTPGRVSRRRISVEASTCSASQRRPRTPKRSLTGGLPYRLRISVACTWFFARVRCRTSCALAEIRRRRIRVCSSGSQTAGRKPPASSFASVRASILSVFAPARVIPLTAFGLAEHHPAHLWLDDPRDPQRVAGRLQRDLIVDSETLRKQRQRRRLRLHPPRQPHLATLRDRDLAEVAMDVQTNEAHRSPPLARCLRGDEAGDATTTDPCARHTRTVAGAATYKQRARSP